jgi:hypothetical protein
MHILEHLFLVREFPARAHLQSGLTLEQATLCPDGASHSIYDEIVLPRPVVIDLNSAMPR